MSDIEKVVVKTEKLESLLREQYHAQGKELHQLISSCEGRLPHDIVPQLRYIATVSNKIINGNGFKFDNQKRFFDQFDACIQSLTPRSVRFVWRAAWGVFIVMTLGSLIFYYLNWEELSRYLFE
ncbi:DUF4145 domain-containing protein [Vibrio sp. RC27]